MRGNLFSLKQKMIIHKVIYHKLLYYLLLYTTYYTIILLALVDFHYEEFGVPFIYINGGRTA